MPIEFKRVSDSRVEFVYDGAFDDHDLERAHEQWLAFMKKADAERRQVVLLADGARSQGMSASQRRATADFQVRHEALIRRVCIAQAVVIISSVQRGILTAILWLKPPPTLLKAFGTRSEATAFLDDMERGRAQRTGENVTADRSR
jgi:hypothetical protein